MVFLSTFLLEIFIRVYICNIYKMNLILRGGREEETLKKKGKMLRFSSSFSDLNVFRLYQIF